MRLIDNASQGHKLWSVRLWTLAVAIAALEPALPEWHGVLPEWAYTAAAAVIGAAGLIARFVPQDIRRG